MDLGLRDRVAVVAAGSKGLGRAVAGALVAEGAKVVLCARGQEALAQACRELTDAGGRCHTVVADVALPSDVARVIDEAQRVFGPVEILVTNSGGPKAGRFETLTPEDWDAATRVLLTSVVNFVHAVLPSMRVNKWGRILNVTSIAAKQDRKSVV